MRQVAPWLVLSGGTADSGSMTGVVAVATFVLICSLFHRTRL